MKITVRPIEPMSSFGRQYVAVTENGEVIDSHYCSSDNFAKQDLGVIEHGFGVKRRQQYLEKFPEGIEVVFDSTVLDLP